jgi:hypothetical protein
MIYYNSFQSKRQCLIAIICGKITKKFCNSIGYNNCINKVSAGILSIYQFKKIKITHLREGRVWLYNFMSNKSSMTKKKNTF